MSIQRKILRKADQKLLEKLNLSPVAWPNSNLLTAKQERKHVRKRKREEKAIRKSKLILKLRKLESIWTKITYPREQPRIYNGTVKKVPKRVRFSDGIKPGEGTSDSDSENDDAFDTQESFDDHIPPPLPPPRSPPLYCVQPQLKCPVIHDLLYFDFNLDKNEIVVRSLESKTTHR